MLIQSNTTVIFLLANPRHFTVERVPVSKGTKEKKSYERNHSAMANIPMPSGNCSNNQVLIQLQQVLWDTGR